eukprot:bmy_09661T0
MGFQESPVTQLKCHREARFSGELLSPHLACKARSLSTILSKTKCLDSAVKHRLVTTPTTASEHVVKPRPPVLPANPELRDPRQNERGHGVRKGQDHLPEVAEHTSYIGEKRPALEKTGDLRYLRRPASKRSLPAKYKPEYVGEIGWGIPAYDFINKTRLQTGFHVKYEEFSQAAVEKLSHRYQNPW